MCKHKVLVQGEHGYVVLCQGCGRYQLAFGTSLITFVPEDYERFCAQVSRQAAAFTSKQSDRDTLKRVYLETCQPALLMVLSARELHLLQRMLGEAAFTAEVDLLLEESHIKPQEH